MDFLKWYKNIIDSAEEQPPARVWEEIQNELDVDQVWTEIDKEMKAGRRKDLVFRLSMAASVLLIIALGTILFSEAGRSPSAKIITVNDPAFPASIPESTYKPSIIAYASEIRDFPRLRNIRAGNEKIVYTGSESIVIAREDYYSLPQKKSIPDISKYNVISSGGPYSLSGEEPSTDKKEVTSGGYYAGVSGHLANTWLLNNKTLQGLRRDEFTASLPSFGYNLGITAGKKVSRRLDIQAELYIVSLTRQNYNEYLHGRYINNSIQFNYSSLTLSGRWLLLNRQGGSRHLLVTGAYTGILKNAMQDINGESISLKNEYNTADYGIIAGYEYLHPVGNNFYVGTGFQTKLGLNNIFAGNEIIPDYLNSTRNLSINLILSVRYNIK
ncbi:MAG: hypothetical protein R6U58_01595 [Bacteroidales bacterium]